MQNSHTKSSSRARSILKGAFLAVAIPAGLMATFYVAGVGSHYTMRGVSNTIDYIDRVSSDYSSDNIKILCGDKTERDAQAAKLVRDHLGTGGHSTTLYKDARPYKDCDRLVLY